jgi:hypothetical protein
MARFFVFCGSISDSFDVFTLANVGVVLAVRVRRSTLTDNVNSMRIIFLHYTPPITYFAAINTDRPTATTLR